MMLLMMMLMMLIMMMMLLLMLPPASLVENAAIEHEQQQRLQCSQNIVTVAKDIEVFALLSIVFRAAIVAFIAALMPAAFNVPLFTRRLHFVKFWSAAQYDIIMTEKPDLLRTDFTACLTAAAVATAIRFFTACGAVNCFYCLPAATCIQQHFLPAQNTNVSKRAGCCCCCCCHIVFHLNFPTLGFTFCHSPWHIEHIAVFLFVL